MNVAITGASGYVGGLLVRRHAERGDRVHALVRRAPEVSCAGNVRYFSSDLLDPASVPSAFFEGADVLYHCAAELTREPLMRCINVDATRVLLDAARSRVSHWIQLSTVAVYGDERRGLITEESELRPATLYSRTKAEADRLVSERFDGAAHSFTIVRPSTVIGQHMRSRTIVGLVDAIDRGLFFFVGRPGAIANYVHEESVVDALVLCAIRPAARNRSYNLSQDCPLERLVEAISKAIDRPMPRLRVPERLARVAAFAGRVAPSFPLTSERIDALTRRVEFPTERIERELGYSHRGPLEVATRELAAAWKKSRS